MITAIVRTFQFSLLALALFSTTSSALAKGDLSNKQARKLIAAMPGFALQTNAIRVTDLRAIDASNIEASAEIATAFRFEKGQSGQWRVGEFRTGQEQWQSIELVARALKVTPKADGCDAIEPGVSGPQTSDPTNRRARCLLAELFAVRLPSDSIRIREISPMVLPLSSKASAVVEALVGADFRLSRNAGASWRVAGIRIGARDWVDPDAVLSAVNSEKAKDAQAELETIAKALEAFRGQRGFYVESKSEAALIDFLSPRYLARVIRLDPWRRPYLYEGTRDRYTLRSAGPDGKENTADDIVMSKPRA